jgi:hypothetical protein
MRGRVSLFEFTVNPAKEDFALLIQNIDHWVRTSPIKDWVDEGEKIVVNTQNSTYELHRV